MYKGRGWGGAGGEQRRRFVALSTKRIVFENYISALAFFLPDSPSDLKTPDFTNPEA